MDALTKFMSSRRAYEGKFNILSMAGGKWYVDEDETDDYEQFVRLYSDAIAQQPVCYQEKLRSINPVIIDLDFKGVTERVSQQQVVRFVGAVMQTLPKFVKVDDGVRAVVFERERDVYGDRKDGVHILIPSVVTVPEIQLKVREIVMPQMASIFEGVALDCTWEECYDKDVITKNAWMMYGSAKPNCKPYLPKYEVDAGGSVVDYVATEPVVNVKRFALYNKHFSSPLLPSGEQVISAASQLPQRVLAKKSTRPSNLDNEDVERLLRMLKPTRSTEYSEWIDVGFALGNTYAHDEDEGLRLFHVFSQSSYKYNPSDVDKKWWEQCTRQTREETARLTLGAIKHWANKDNPAEYTKYCEELKRLCGEDWPADVAAFATGCEEPVADYVVRKCLKGDTVCVDATRYVFYVFDGSLWEKRTGLNLIKHDVASKVRPVMEELVQSMEDKAKLAEGTDDDDMWRERVKKVMDVSLRFMTKRFVDNVLSYVAGHPLVYDGKFEERLDLNPHKLACKNGMLDLRTGEMKPFDRLDYVSKTLDIDYDADAPRAIFEKFISGIMCDDIEKVLYLQVIFGYALTGSMQENITPFLIGKGGSGVSTIVKLIKAVMGKDLARNVPNDLICTIRQGSRSSNLDYERARLKGARLGLFAELSGTMQFNSDFLKITGGDEQNARKAYEDAGEFKPTHMSLCFGNGMPIQPVDTSINNLVRRIRIITFNVVHAENPVAFRTMNPFFQGEIKQLDTTILDSMLKEKEGVLAWMVMGAMRWYAECNMRLDSVCPASVRKDTEDYLVRKDTLSNFIEDECVLGPNLVDEDGNTLFNKRGQLATNAVSGTALLNAYNKYRDANGMSDKVDAEGFARVLLARLGDKGVSRPSHVTVDGKKVRGYKGISLKFQNKDWEM